MEMIQNELIYENLDPNTDIGRIYYAIKETTKEYGPNVHVDLFDLQSKHILPIYGFIMT